MGYKCVSPVAVIFFNRPSTLKLVFEKIRQVQPSKLFLIQDGARIGKNDDEKIRQCREIVGNVDWECEVLTNYSKENMGCGERPQSGISWVLSIVDRTIILEDDCVPNESFFRYCDQMLERYKNDERIAYISGLNHFEKWAFGNSSYGFTKYGAIWGWATWKRAWDNYDYSVSKITDPYIEHLLILADEKERVEKWKITNKAIKNEEKLSYWDHQWGFTKYSQGQLVIVPKYNLISNIGVGSDSTHAMNKDESHKRFFDYCNMPTFELEFPLIHPQHMLCDLNYDKCVKRCNGIAKLRFSVAKNIAIRLLIEKFIKNRCNY